MRPTAQDTLKSLDRVDRRPTAGEISPPVCRGEKEEDPLSHLPALFSPLRGKVFVVVVAVHSLSSKDCSLLAREAREARVGTLSYRSDSHGGYTTCEAAINTHATYSRVGFETYRLQSSSRQRYGNGSWSQVCFSSPREFPSRGPILAARGNKRYLGASELLGSIPFLATRYIQQDILG